MQPTNEQRKILGLEGNVVTKARVATGKTTLCQFRIEKALNEGMSPKAIWYGGWLRSYRDEGKKRMAHLPISITTIHSQRYRSSRVLRRRFSKTEDFDDLLEAATDKEKKFKLLVIDELQDINPHLYYVITSLVAKDGVIFAVGDDRQKKDWLDNDNFDPFSQFEADYGVECQYMVHNQRNARKIVEAAERLYPDGMKSVRNIEGKVIFNEPEDYNNLIILTRTNHEAQEVSALLPVDHYLQYIDSKGREERIGDPNSSCKVMTIYQFSGREADRVWLIDWETELKDLEWNLFFIGITRARNELYITSNYHSVCYELTKHNIPSYGGILLD